MRYVLQRYIESKGKWKTLCWSSDKLILMDIKEHLSSGEYRIRGKKKNAKENRNVKRG